MIVNGKEYSMWGQFVENKNEWIGGILQELQDGYSRMSDENSPRTKIIDIKLAPNGEEHAYFSVDGKNYGCGGSTEVLGVIAGEDGWITFSGYGGHKWRIKKP